MNACNCCTRKTSMTIFETPSSFVDHEGGNVSQEVTSLHQCSSSRKRVSIHRKMIPASYEYKYLNLIDEGLQATQKCPKAQSVG